VQLLLDAAPNTASAADPKGQLPLHLAAQHGRASVVQLLLAAAPDTVLARDSKGHLPLHCAAWGGHARMLLPRANPETALAEYGHAVVVQQLLAAAPGTALERDGVGRLPLQLALLHLKQEGRHAALIAEFWLSVSRCLLAADTAANVLNILAEGGPLAMPLFADFILCRPPLTAAEWALVPAPCPGLGRALSTVMAHSTEQARQLVRHLPAEDVQRLRTFALCLALRQRQLRIFLPAPLTQRILSLFDA